MNSGLCGVLLFIYVPCIAISHSNVVALLDSRTSVGLSCTILAVSEHVLCWIFFSIVEHLKARVTSLENEKLALQNKLGKSRQHAAKLKKKLNGKAS